MESYRRAAVERAMKVQEGDWDSAIGVGDSRSELDDESAGLA
jgi:hypothetical protein